MFIGVLAATFALAAVACGGDNGAVPDVTVDEEELRSAVRDTRNAAQDAITDLSGASTREEAADALRSGAEELDSAADRLDETEAPEDAEAAKHDLVQAAREIADAFEQAAPNVESGNLGDLAETIGNIQTLDAFRAFDRALEELRQSGIDVPPVNMTG